MGSSPFSVSARRVIAPVCQCSSMRPVVSTIGNSSSGIREGSYLGIPCVKMIEKNLVELEELINNSEAWEEVIIEDDSRAPIFYTKPLPEAT